MAQEIITPIGDFFTNSSGSMSSTLGEPVNETFSGSLNVLTQGFQQSKLTITSLKELPNLDYTIIAFPNPAKEYVTIKSTSKKNENLLYEIYDNSGKLLKKKQFDGSETQISFCDLKPSDYYVKVISGQKEVKVIKIVKQ
jgi:hypothetical protein